jgi:hypothetical protein
MHEAMIKDSWRLMDVYKEKEVQNMGVIGLKLLDAVRPTPAAPHPAFTQTGDAVTRSYT